MAKYGARGNFTILSCLEMMQSRKHEKVATWQVGVRGVGLVGTGRQLAPLSVSDFLVNFLPV